MGSISTIAALSRRTPSPPRSLHHSPLWSLRSLHWSLRSLGNTSLHRSLHFPSFPFIPGPVHSLGRGRKRLSLCRRCWGKTNLRGTHVQVSRVQQLTEDGPAANGRPGSHLRVQLLQHSCHQRHAAICAGFIPGPVHGGCVRDGADAHACLAQLSWTGMSV